MRIFAKPRFLPLSAAALIGTIVGYWLTASPSPLMAHDMASTRHCASTICTNRLWMRAPILRVRSW